MKVRSLALAVLASGFIAACAAQGSGDELANGTSSSALTSDAQRIELARAIFAAQDASAWSFRFEGEARRPVHVAGISRPVLPQGTSPYAATLAFLSHMKDRFAIEAPDLHIRQKLLAVDKLGMKHVRLQQVERGVPVLGAEMMAHFDAKGSLRSLDSTYVYDLDNLDLSPNLTPNQARDIAEADLRSLTGIALTELDTNPELVIHVPRREDTGRPVLAFHLDLRSPEDPGIWMDYTIDAHSGAIAKRFNKVMGLVGTGVGVTGDTKNIEVSQYGDKFALMDTTRTPNGIATYDAHNKGTPLAGMLMPGTGSLPGDLIMSPSKDGPWDPAAVDANFFAGVTYDFYKKNFGRKGIDDKDGKIVSSVHVLKKWNNAQWAEFDGKQMIYGDGDGEIMRPMSAEVDVVAHELTHGVTFGTSKLTYAGESGALNEAISDMFGAMVSHDYHPDPAHYWCLGEQVLMGKYEGKCLREFAHPSQAAGPQPDHMSKYVDILEGGINGIADLGGVHTNSGIPNNAFYLMTVGGTNDTSKIEVKSGIGWEKVAQIWYRTNVHYLTSNSGFSAAADANLSAANDLGFTENQKNIIECAWIAVGVRKGECKDIQPEAIDPGADAGASGDPTADGGDSQDEPDSGTGTESGTTDGASSESSSAEPESGCSASRASRAPGSLVSPLALGAVALIALRRRRTQASGPTSS